MTGLAVILFVLAAVMVVIALCMMGEGEPMGFLVCLGIASVLGISAMQLERAASIRDLLETVSEQLGTSEQHVKQLTLSSQELTKKLEGETLRALEAEKSLADARETINELMWQLQTCEDQKDSSRDTVKSIKEILEN